VFGFVDGQNLKLVVNGFDVHDDQFAEVAATLANASADAVFCISDAATRAARQYGVPIVAVSPDMVAGGLVHSLARPGGNLTGVGILAAELDSKRLEILMDVLPGARRIAVMADPKVTQPAEFQVLQNAARARDVELMIFTAGAPEQIAPTMEKAKASGATALNTLAAPLFSFNRRILFEQAAALGLPAIYEWPDMAEEGGLIAYGPRLATIYRQAARLLVKVLRGAKPEDLPVEQPTNFELVINLATAKALGLTIPESFLMRADKVIE
jgi:putative ABC transport system substrate-binding protein